MIYYRQVLTFRCMYLPLFFLLAFVSALGVSLWLSALNVEYRDVRYAIPFLSQLWMFATPIAYPSSLLHEPWRAVYGLNPMAGVVEGFRWALVGADTAPGPVIIASSCAAFAVADRWSLLFPANGKDLCGCGVTMALGLHVNHE